MTAPLSPLIHLIDDDEAVRSSLAGVLAQGWGVQRTEGKVAQVYQHDNGFIKGVQLADGTVVRVQAQSELQLRQLRRRGRAGSVQSVLEMHKGGVESTVPPSAEPLRRMEIRTPLAVTSVAVPRLGCIRISTAGKPISTAAVSTVRGDGGSGCRCRYQAIINGRLSLSSSEGCR